MKEKICEICGSKFIPTSGRQKCCNKPITRNCIVCGKPYESTCSQYPVLTCGSEECKINAKFNHVNNSLSLVKCKNCGEVFKPTSLRQIYCKKEKSKRCSICGKEFKYICGDNVPETCSSECQAKLIQKSRAESASLLVKKCKWCGKEFVPKSHRDVYCDGPHFRLCEVCGKEFEIHPEQNATVKTCSTECTNILIARNHDYSSITQKVKQTMLDKYGFENSFSVPELREKAKQTSLLKYGKEYFTQTDEYKEKVKQTDLEKYGVEHHLKSKDVINKRIETVKQKYGTENVFQSDDVKEKSKQTNIEKYGVEYISQCSDIIDKIRSSNISKYGVSHPMMLEEFQNKAQQTNLNRYGRRAYTQQHIKDISEWYAFMDNPKTYISTKYSHSPTSAELAHDLGVDVSTVDEYLKKNNAIGSVRRIKSHMEEDIVSLIRCSYPKLNIICNTRSVIPGYELDIYIPDLKFAIECNPTCTHNSSVNDPWGGEPKHYKYHQIKTNLCEEKGISLFHVFGNEWTHKRDIIESMILNRIGKSKIRIYARKCNVKCVSGSDSMIFLNENHRQGNANSPIRLGLEYEGEIVSLMTFGKMRSGIGTGSENLDDCYELVRFCSKRDVEVVGGASKLFKYFITTYSPQRVRSFSDRAHTSGKLYAKLNFKEVNRSSPSYTWVNVVDDTAYNRVNAQKKNIKKFLKDETIDLSRTETEIMIEHGFVQVFDSGTITWEWQK